MVLYPSGGVRAIKNEYHIKNSVCAVIAVELSQKYFSPRSVRNSPFPIFFSPHRSSALCHAEGVNCKGEIFILIYIKAFRQPSGPPPPPFPYPSRLFRYLAHKTLPSLNNSFI